MTNSKKALLLGLAMGVSSFAGPVYAEEAKEETFELDPVVVTATRVGQNTMKVPADVTVLTAKDWEDKGAVTMADALEGTPGVAVSRYNGRSGVAIPYINGSDRVVVLIDGVRMNAAQGISSGKGGIDLNNFNIDANSIDRIEVVRGGGSALYGADAVGGVIQIFTKKGSKDGKSYIGLAFGDDQQQQYQIGTSGADGKYRWRLNGSYYTTDGFRENGFGRDGDISLRLDRDTAGGDLFFTYDYHWEKYGLPGYTISPTPGDYGKVLRQTYNLGYNKEGFNLQIYQNHKKQNGENWGSYRYDETLNGILYDGNSKLSDSNLLSWGVDLREDKVESTKYSAHKKRRTQAYFLQDELTLGKLILTPGLRYEDNSDFGDQWLPKIGAVWSASSDFSFFANWGKVFRAPSFDDLYYVDAYMQGNPNLTPEKGWSVETGVKKNFGDNHSVTLTYFNRDMKDAMKWMPGATWMDPWTVENIDSYRTQGIVLAWNGKLTSYISMDANYTYLDSKTSEPVNEPQHQGHMGIHYENKRFRQSLTMDAVSKQDQVTNNAINGYAVFNTSTQYNISKDQKIYLNIYNLFDHKYDTVKYYPANGISFMAGWEMKF